MPRRKLNLDERYRELLVSGANNIEISDSFWMA